ncbi:MAG: hypothetical protein Q4Q53_05750 [Methanocorpusculum sp.]|nr:hypothetical protein [Methanocorpusculum sp.]
MSKQNVCKYEGYCGSKRQSVESLEISVGRIVFVTFKATAVHAYKR